jgi:signal transduction histidine kinase
MLFSLITLPLAVSLARRVDRGQRGRTEMLRHSLEAWSRERRRIAQELHDGVVQDLAAVGYSLHFLLDELPASSDRARTTGTRAAELLSQAVSSLRDVVGDLLPPDSGAGDLSSALSALASAAREGGVEVVVDLDPHVAMDRDVSRIVIWVVREGLVNVVKHAEAKVATVSVRSDGDHVVIRVADDGRGPAGAPADTDRHVGLQLLRRSLDEMGGLVETGPADGGGFVLTARMPVVLGDRAVERVGGG